MAWIAAAISVVGGVVKAGIDSENAKKYQGANGMAGGMDLGKMWYQDSSMNNSGWIVTTNGSKANATANTDSTKNPSTQASAQTPNILGMPTSGGGLDMNLILIAGAAFLLLGKK